MKPNKRVLTVARGLREAGKKFGPVPRILLEGRYLEDAGFLVGGKIEMTVEPNKLVIILGDKYEDEKNHREVLDLSAIDPTDVIVQYKDQNGIWRKELFKTERVKGFHKIASIPQRVTGLALGDLIKVDEQFGHLFFNSVVKHGDHQTIQVQLLKSELADERLLEIAKLTGCTAVRRAGGWISMSAPKATPYDPLFRFLDNGAKNGHWKYCKASI